MDTNGILSNNNMQSANDVLLDIYKIYAKKAIYTDKDDEDKIFLNGDACKMFCSDKIMQNKVIELVTLFNKKLVLIANGDNINFNDDSCDLSKLGIAYELDFSFSDIKIDVNTLINVHTLKLDGCYLMNADGLVNVGVLNNVHTLSLSECEELEDVNALGLGTVHTLNLSNCYDLTDVHTLGTIYILDLSSCCELIDVSALGLGIVHTLNLSNCTKIEDVGTLGTINTLNLTNCTLIFKGIKLYN